MEEYEHVQGMDNDMLGLDLVALDSLPFEGGVQWLSTQGHFGYFPPPFEVNSAPLEFFGTLDLQSSNFFSSQLDSPSLVPMGPVPGYELGGLWYDNYPGIEGFSVGSSSTMSEAFSPPSEHMFSSLPASPVTAFGPPSQPIPYPYPVPGPLNLPMELGAAPGPPLEELEKMEFRTPEPRPSPPRRIRRRHRSVGDPPIPKRQLRKIELPEVCGYCKKGFQYIAELNRHIVSRHTAEDNKPKYSCNICHKVYTRTDRLYRHGVDKHGWPPGGNKRKRRAVGGGKHQQSD